MPRNIKSIAIRVGSLGSATTSVAVSSAVTFPVLLSQLGLSAWGNLAFAQALGLMIATLGNWGYQGFGQKLVAAKPREIQVGVLFEATQLRVLVVTLLFSASCALLFVYKSDNFLALSACAGAYLFIGLSNTWYFQGTDTTYRAVWLEALPKIAAMWVAIGSLILYGSFLVFSLVFLLCSFVASSIPLLKVLGPSTILRAARTCFQSVAALRKTWMGASASAVSLVYMVLPTVMIGIVAPLALPTYALLERLIRFASLGLSPITASIQSWVLIDQADQRIEITIRKSRLTIFVFALVVGFGFTCFINFLASYMVDFSQSVPLALIVLAALTLSASVTTQVLGSAFLGAQNNLKYQLFAAGSGAIAWILVGPLGILFFNGFGAQCALAVAELTVLVVQVIRVSSIRRNALTERGVTSG